jgi:hypothetical protein
MIKRSGERGWQKAEYPLAEGVHILEWLYVKDPNTFEGSDKAWIDMVKFPAFSFLQHDIAVDSLVSPSEPSKEYSEEQIKAGVINFGRDTIYSLPMAYRINSLAPVTETFSVEIFPGDSATVTFLEPANLSDQGQYQIRVYLTAADDYDMNDTILRSVISTAINDIIINSADFSIGPNPFTVNTRISSYIDLPKTTFSLFDNRGRKIWEYRSPYVSKGDQILLHGEQLSGGFYILRINTTTGTYLYKLIKN